MQHFYKTLNVIIAQLTYKLKPFTELQIRRHHLGHIFYDLFAVEITEKYQQSTGLSFEDFVKYYIENDIWRQNYNSDIFVNATARAIETQNYLEEKFTSFKQEDIRLLGDKHGDRVLKFEYEKNVYFTRFLDIEQLLDITSQVYPHFKKYFYTYKRYNDEFYVREYVETNIKDVNLEEFYTNYGEVIVLVLLFKAIDIIRDNVLIKSPNIPFLFDLDFVVTPELDYLEHEKEFEYNILHTGIVTDKGGNNFSSMFGGTYTKQSILRPIVTFDNNTYFIKWFVDVFNTLESYPSEFEGHPYQYLDKILKGFNSASSVILPKLDVFIKKCADVNFNTRILTRATAFYKFILMNTLYSKVREHYTNRTELFTAFLKKKDHLSRYQFDIPALLDYEIKELEAYTYPYFYANVQSNNIYSIYGDKVGVLNEPPLTDYLKYLGNFSSNLEVFKTSLADTIKKNHSQWEQAKVVKN